MESQIKNNLRQSYDTVAEDYVARIYDELKDKPLDRQLLDKFAENIDSSAPVCDLGCGPGMVARYLHEKGLNVTGIDLSPKMIEQARRLNPDIIFQQGDMQALEIENETFAGVVAFYSLIHTPREEMIPTLIEIRRSLKAGGILLMAFHLGAEVIHAEDWWEKKVSLDFIFFTSEEMIRYLSSAGFIVAEIIERPPYKNIEYQSHRAYLTAKKM